MKNLFIFHGTEGHPEENWFPWLKVEMEKLGYEVIIPQFPTPEGQNPEEWFKVIEPYISLFNDETIIVGHSAGGLFLLNLLQQLKKPIGTVVFVAASAGIEPLVYSHMDQPFLKEPFNWPKIKSAAKKCIVFHSEDDPYIPVTNANKIATELRADYTLLEDAGHFNEKAGYTTFPELLTQITQL